MTGFKLDSAELHRNTSCISKSDYQHLCVFKDGLKSFLLTQANSVLGTITNLDEM